MNIEQVIEEIEQFGFDEPELVELSDVIRTHLKLLRDRAARTLVRKVSPGMRVRVKPGLLKSNDYDNKVFEVVDPKRTRVEVRLPGISDRTVVFPASVLELA